MLAAVILSLVGLLFYAVVWAGLKTTKRSREIAEKYTGARVVLDVMGKELRSCFPFDFRDIPNFVLASGGRELTFWITVPDEMQVHFQYPFQFCRIHYYMTKTDSGEDILYKRVESFPPGKYEKFEGRVLKGKFGFKVGEINKVEQEDWTELLKIPEAVKISLEIEGGYVLERVVYLPYAQRF
jgi:hypothetical protein